MTDSLIEAAESFTLLEAVAVIASFLYLIFAVMENIWCWFFSLISVILYFIILSEARLWAETALQVYYLGTTAYGFYSWKFKAEGSGEQKRIEKSGLKRHLLFIGIISVGTATAGYFLRSQTDAALPYLDSFTTVGALVVTYMVTQKYLENWLYWIIVDGAAVYLYVKMELYLTALLFLLYVIMVVFGYFNWLKKYDEQTA